MNFYQQFVKVVKLSSITELSKTSPVNDSYEVYGTVLVEPKVGGCIAIARVASSKHPGQMVGGLFRTSPIKLIDGNKFVTENSEYSVELFDRKDLTFETNPA